MDKRPQNTGYMALAERAGVSVFRHCHESIISTGNAKRIEKDGGQTTTWYPWAYHRGDRICDHLDFALRHEGVNLQILSRVFKTMPAAELVDYVRSKPTGQNTRRAWYLYERLTGRRLPLDDLTVGNFVNVLDPADYVTADPVAVRRQRVNDNLLGPPEFCPIVRRTEWLEAAMDSDLSDRARRIVEQYPMDVLRRALAYLYTKESKSSFEIEHIKPDASRTERFVAQLRLAESQDFFTRPRLIELQNRIVESRYVDRDYRTGQNYVGQAVAWQNERIHYVSPRPQDLDALMSGMLASHQRMGASDVHPVVHAAVIAYGFVFMHPFEDGNGRIHRFLIHNILSRRRFVPPGVIFPVSAVMLNKSGDYDASLEAFSRPLLSQVQYRLDEAGHMTVQNDTADFYRSIDFTPQAEALFGFIAETIETEMISEIRFILNYDRARKSIQSVVDMPDRRIDLFIKTCLGNNGKLSKNKHNNHFPELTSGEIDRMEIAVRESYSESRPEE